MIRTCEQDAPYVLQVRSLCQLLITPHLTLKKHLETVHKTTTLVEKDQGQGDNSRKQRRGSGDSGEPGQQKQQCMLFNKGKVSPEMVHRLIAGYVVEDVLPLSTVESPAFRRLISGISSVKVPDRKSFTQHLHEVYKEMEKKVREALENIDSVSTTADVWTAHNCTYFEMTVHWIDPVGLRCCKAAICCIRIVGRHTYDVLAAKIEHIHCVYSLNGKVTATVTDNGSNFVKAFTTFSLPVSDSSSETTTLPAMQEYDFDLDEGKSHLRALVIH